MNYLERPNSKRIGNDSGYFFDFSDSEKNEEVQNRTPSKDEEEWEKILLTIPNIRTEIRKRNPHGD